MGSTNKTANLGLSQFIGTDKPTWLVDYNNDMSVIDVAIGELQNDSGLTDTAIAELQTNVQNLQSEQGDSATEIAEVKSDVQTLDANYETMHHELVLNQNDIETAKTSIDSLNEVVTAIGAYSFKNIDNLAVPNKQTADFTTIAEIDVENGVYLINAVFNTPKNADSGKVVGFGVSLDSATFGNGRYMYMRDVTKADAQTFLSLTTFVKVTAGKLFFNIQNETSGDIEAYCGIAYTKLA